MEAITRIFKTPKYLILFLIIALLTFLIKTLAINLDVIIYTLRNSGIISTLMLTKYILYGTTNTMSQLMLFTNVLVSLLTGLALSLLILRMSVIRAVNKLDTTSGSFGAVIGLVAPACPSCSIGLLSLLGISAGVSALPFNGAEFTYLSIGLLLFSIYLLRKNINSCKIK